MAHALTFSGTKGASTVGSSWQHEENLPKAQSLRKLAHQLGPNVRWSVAFKSAYDTFQSVLCESIVGVKPSRVRPLAAIAVIAHPQSWAGLYHLGGEYYWYIATHQGQAVITGSDQVGMFSELATIRVYHQPLPGQIGIEGNLNDLANLARQATSVSALHNMQPGSWRTAALVVTVTTFVVGTIFDGRYLYGQQQEAERLVAQTRQKVVVAHKAAATAQQRTQP